MRAFAHNTLVRFDAQVQLKLVVNPIDAFVVPGLALDIAQMQVHQTKSPSTVLL